MMTNGAAKYDSTVSTTESEYTNRTKIDIATA